MMKKCFKCGEGKDRDEFYSHKQMTDGLLGKCKECTKKDVAKRRQVNRVYYNSYDKNRYRTNIHRFLGSKYDSMRGRIYGKTVHSKLVGKKLMPENEFMSWCYNSVSFHEFMRLYKRWKESGHQRKLAPSIDRIDNKIGYVIGNLQWLTQSENSSKYNH